jgi:hypothetical protein
MVNKQWFKASPTSEALDQKVSEFSNAIKKYNTASVYTSVEMLLAIAILTLQILSVVQVIQTYHYHGGLCFLFTLLAAYLITDFVNGLVHMLVDNNTNYTSRVGPFIAAFHMHHYTLKYTEKNPLKIYFTESGHKFWLGFYLIGLTVLQQAFSLNENLNLGLVAFGLFSSIAEVSHYWCHNPPKNNALIAFLQEHRVLLSLKHHRLHHIQDNMNYAFLNGISDPLLNVIARNFFNGYKNRSDEHVARYIKGHQSVNNSLII